MLHRRQVFGWIVAILYGALPAFASEPAPVTTPAPAATSATVAKPAANPPETPVVPHIALLLPLGSGALARPAEAVRTGFLAAEKVHGKSPLPVRVYSVPDDARQVVAGYRLALNNGARAVVGPLTRAGVTAIAASDIVTVPTLALNVPEARLRVPPNFFILSLGVEFEAAQIARLAWQDGRRNAMTLVSDSPLMKRMLKAFVDEFSRLGGKHVAEYTYTAELAGLSRLKQAAALGVTDFAFLALDAQQARMVRPYVASLPLYGSSQVHPGSSGILAGFDLAGIRILDMPWLLQPDHPAVMVYPRPDFRAAVDLDRLYALGIDAFRLVLELLEGRKEVALDGVTGRILLGPDQQFARNLTGARFTDGKLVPIEAPRP